MIEQLRTEKRYEEEIKEQLNRKIAEQENFIHNKETELKKLNEEY